jgi:putative transposase
MAQGLKRDKVLAVCNITKNQFYHKPIGGKRGRKRSEFTMQKVDDTKIRRTNGYVKQFIKRVFDEPLTDYGYHRMTSSLQLSGFYINHKKVYRLMREARLLRARSHQTPKDYVKYRVVCPEGSLRLMEMDIKQIWVEGLQRRAFVLTILDVFTRCVLYWEASFSMKQQQVEAAWQQVIENHLEPAGALAWELHIEIRSDNGPQFCAQKMREFFKENYLAQTFTHPYTPQENGHIESFHAIVARALRGENFTDATHLRNWLTRFYTYYNYERIHTGSLCLPPMTFASLWEEGHITRTVISEKERKVRFQLQPPRQDIKLVSPAGNENQREVSSLIFEGLDAPKNHLVYD